MRRTRRGAVCSLSAGLSQRPSRSDVMPDVPSRSDSTADLAESAQGEEEGSPCYLGIDCSTLIEL